MRENPFAAPQHDEAPPLTDAELIDKLATKPWPLRILGLYEIVLGAALAGVALLGGGLTIAKRGNLTSSASLNDLVAIGITLVVAGFCVAAGYKLTHRKSWKPLFLQLVPLFVTTIIVWALASL